MVGRWPPSKREREIIALGQSLVIIGCGVQKHREDNIRSKKEALQLKNAK